MTLSSLACSFFLFVIAILLSYLSGIMLGRSHPIVSTSPLPTAVRERMLRGANPDGELAKGEHSDGKASVQKILEPGELAFSRMLRAAPGEILSETAVIRPLAPAVSRGPNGTLAKMPPGMSPAVIEGPPQPPAQKADTYDFVFQVAAYRTQAMADRLRLRIESKGYRGKLEHSGRLYVVLLLTRGPLSRVDEVRSDMQKLSMGVPMERSRRPVLRPAVR